MQGKEIRMQGYYWLKYKNIYTVGFWADGRWFLCGLKLYSDSDISEINENRISAPDESFQYKINIDLDNQTASVQTRTFNSAKEVREMLGK